MQADPTPPQFDEGAYMLANPDVAAAVKAGHHASGRDHYDNFGRAEGRPLGQATVAARPHGFDEAWYLAGNPDVAAGVSSGTIPSAFAHWVRDGRAEGRNAPPDYDESGTFDEAFYLRSYPAAGRDIARARAVDAQDHYETLGRQRGYRRNDLAPRPGSAPRHGAAWLDDANALDQIEGRVEIGTLSPRQAGLLRHWVRHGYVVLERVMPAVSIEQAAEDVSRAFSGEIAGVGFGPPQTGRDPAALDLHWLSEPIRDVILAEPVRELLELIFQRRAMAVRSLALADQGGADTLCIPCSVPSRFAASWIAFADVTASNGRTGRAGRDPEPFVVKQGDAVIWHADLPHGPLPVGLEAMRAGIVTQYCPAEVAPLLFEQGGASVRSHHGLGWYATGCYPATVA